ncbi:MAG: hypothetical protein K5848_05250 [Lachnospiraceae bacterium]|nr:hypothetical protein [Lachnospiraceae bacterium]
MKKYILLLVLGIMAIIGTAFADETEKNDDSDCMAINEQLNLDSLGENFWVDADNASLIARYHIGSIIAISKESDGWSWGINLSDPISMYDFSGKTSAYFFQITDSADYLQGYVIIGANIMVAPVVEFATTGDFCPYNVMRKMNADTLLYNGGYGYYIQDGDRIYDVSCDGSINELSDDEKDRIVNNGFFYEEHSKEWEAWKKILEEWTGGSNPPSSGMCINPYNYESGFSGHIEHDVTSYNNTYKTSSSFSGYTNHCAPIAATNIMIYWYNRNPATYGCLRKYADPTWGATFLQYRSLMQTTSSTGTLNSKLAPSYNTYLYDAGVPAVSTFVSNPTWTQIKAELYANRPIHIVLMASGGGGHSVVGLGYIRFAYSNGTFSNYIRIADGYQSSPTVFVHTISGHAALHIAKVVI